MRITSNSYDVVVLRLVLCEKSEVLGRLNHVQSKTHNIHHKPFSVLI